MSDRPLLLVSNDDGVDAPGILALRTALAAFADVYTVAPQTEQSAKSHSITLHHPLRFHEVEEHVWAVNGTPADCVYVAFFLKDLLPRRPDMVVSGINHGPNLGNDVHYSGTVAAAREGALRGVRSIALSSSSTDMEGAAQYAKRFCRQLLQTTAPAGQAVLLNINFPSVPPQGVRATRLGLRLYSDDVEVRDDPRGRHYLWIGGPGGATSEPVQGADTEAVEEGYISVTPLSIEATQPDHLGVAAYVAGSNGER
ncbi:MAG: 5'/3'-nucleotidase SurE [Deltaproteobacteria bacterium]|nr:5'/3'-nucleotidase SurE [Deltaproteobacteria bacterium]NND30550.1 5'/3'-nucleotidase SurE [Myxococcales bacterium]MBT8466541.1 5'/3'-nucleotidase SurE [Deltaproteobacteria bacterium]MBT8481694.1 5'/3'-nucleotidase SurE [Deltaproteobacteria bacterium]NNK06020.1 5'/3'-nucleotidase SurE [Myxococcales bacterium]